MARKLKFLPPPARKGEVNYGFLDRFTLVHFGIGAAYVAFGAGFWLALGLALLWEVVENPLKANVPSIFPHGTADTFQNVLGDVLAVMVGWSLTNQLFN